MRKIIKTLAFIKVSNRMPIMVIHDGRIRSLETTIKEEIGDTLDSIASRNCGYPSQIEVEDYTVKNLLPHAKKIKITIEIEE